MVGHVRPLFRLDLKYGFHIDTRMNSSIPGEAYTIYVDDAGNVYLADPRVVIFRHLWANPGSYQPSDPSRLEAS